LRLRAKRNPFPVEGRPCTIFPVDAPLADFALRLCKVSRCSHTPGCNFCPQLWLLTAPHFLLNINPSCCVLTVWKTLLFFVRPLPRHLMPKHCGETVFPAASFYPILTPRLVKIAQPLVVGSTPISFQSIPGGVGYVQQTPRFGGTHSYWRFYPHRCSNYFTPPAIRRPLGPKCSFETWPHPFRPPFLSFRPPLNPTHHGSPARPFS